MSGLGGHFGRVACQFKGMLKQDVCFIKVDYVAKMIYLFFIFSIFFKSFFFFAFLSSSIFFYLSLYLYLIFQCIYLFTYLLFICSL